MAARTVLVTGASTGIGRAVALHLDSRGWRVLAGVRRDEDAAALREAGSERLSTVMLDVTDTEQIAAAAREVDADGGALDALVNNAGYVVSGPVEFLDLDSLRRQYEVNVVGQVAVTQALIPALRRAGGRVILTGSIGGRIPLPFLAPYQSSKAALASVAGSLDHELRPWGIRVVTVEPAAVKTPIWDKGKRDVQDLREKLPAEAIDLYGNALRAGETMPEQAAASGMPPEALAQFVERILDARNPRPRYLVGREAKALFTLSRVLPHGVFAKLVQRRMGTA